MPIPPWVVPDHGEVVELDQVARSLAREAESAHGTGQYCALRWVVGVAPAPLTRRRDVAVWKVMRAESWVALCRAAYDDGEPSDREWERLEVAPRPVRVRGDDVDDIAHGVWRTLGWLLGVLPDPPTALPQRAADGTVVTGTGVLAVRRDPESAAWREADARRRARQRVEARRHWTHIRDRLAATEVPSQRDPTGAAYSSA